MNLSLVIKPVIKPVVLASICGLVISTVYFYSKDKISQSRFEYETRQLKEVAGGDDIEISASSISDYELWKDGDPFGHIYAIETDKGYNGKITAWLAVGTGRSDGSDGMEDRDREILGVRIRAHRETPGLGDKIDRRVSDWIEHFRHQSLASIPTKGWRIIKDGGQFDQFTGATITPRAVVNMVYQKLVVIQRDESRERQESQESQERNINRGVNREKTP